MEREVTLKIKVEDADVDAAIASQERLKASMKVTAADAQTALGVSNSAIKSKVAELQAAMSAAEGSFEETIRSYKTQLLALDNQLKSGSLGMADYKSRLALIPPSMQKAVATAKQLGTGLEETTGKSGQLISGFEKLEAATGSMGRHLALAEQGLGTLGAATGPVGIAILAFAVTVGVVIFAAVKLYEVVTTLAEGFAKTGMETLKAEQAWGLSATTVTGLRHELDATGTSTGELDSAMGSFRKTIGEAAAGSTDARKQLSLLGIDGKTAIYDIDGAFKQAVATIVTAPAGIEQARLAFAAFGEDGYKLIPFLQSFHGNVDEAIKKAQELGLQMSGKDVEAAKAFTKSFEDAKGAVEGIKLAFGRDFLDIVAHALNSFTAWVVANKTAIGEWATFSKNVILSVVDPLERLVQLVKDHPWLIRGAVAVGTGGLSEVAIAGIKAQGAYGATVSQKPSLPGQYATDYSRPGDKPADPAALEALRAKAEELQKQREAAAKAELAAQIQLYEMSATELGNAYDKAFTEITDRFKETLDVKEYQSSWDALKQWYGDEINTLAPKWTALVEQQTVASQKGAMEQEVIKRQLEEKQQALNDKTTTHETAAAKTIEQIKKQMNAKQLGELEATTKRAIELYNERDKADIDDRKKALAAGRVTEQQFLDFTEQTELGALDFKKKKLNELLAASSGNAKKRADVEGQLKVVDQQIADQKLANEHRFIPVVQQEYAMRDAINKLEKENADATSVSQRQKLAATTEELNLKQQIASLGDDIFNGGVNDQLKIEAAHLRDVLDYRNREVNAIIATNKAQLDLSHSMEISNNQIRAGVYAHLAAQKTLNQSIVDGINGTYDAITKQADAQLDKLNTWSKGILSFVTEPLKMLLNQNISNMLGSVVDKLFPGTGLGAAMTGTNNPVAKPIVDKIDQTNALLSQLVSIAGAVPIVTSGGGISGIFSALLGGGNGGSRGNGPGGTPYFNPNGGGSSSGLDSIFGGATTGSIDTIFGGNQATGNIWQQITAPGGIFGKEGFGNNVGTYGGIGSIASIVGGLIGGRAGGILSGVGSGIATGAAIGSIIPGIGTAVGAAVGGIIGFFASLFGGNKQRKQDEATLTTGLSNSIAQINQQFDALKQDIQFGADPSNAISQGTSIGQQIRSQYLQMANGLQDKKTRNTALADVSQIDQLIAQKMADLQSISAMASASEDRAKRILPEFAGGHYFADYFRPNGLIPGMFDSRDDMLAMLSRGEMVLNPTQQNNARRAAGFDVFAGAGIPNYPNASPSAKMATGGIASGGGIGLAPTIVQQNNFTLVLQGDTFDERANGWIISDDGSRQLVKVVKAKQKSGDI